MILEGENVRLTGLVKDRFMKALAIDIWELVVCYNVNFFHIFTPNETVSKRILYLQVLYADT